MYDYGASPFAIGTVMTRPKASAVRDVDVSASQAKGYLDGDSVAPVQVMEEALKTQFVMPSTI